MTTDTQSQTPNPSQSQTPSPSQEEPYVPPEGPGPCKWQDIWALAAKTVMTERHLPREFVGLWQGSKNVELSGERAEYCFESTVSEKRTHWVLRETR